MAETPYLFAFLRDTASADAVRTAMQAEGQTAEVQTGTITHAIKHFATNASPEILLVEVPSAEEAPKLLDKLADVVDPNTRVIVTGKIDTYSFYSWLMGLGIAEYLLQPFTDVQFKAALTKGTHVPASSLPPEERKLITVIGARGGVGTTTVAIHLAMIFAKEHGIKTALLDPDAHFGSVALGLDLEPLRGLKDALEKPDRVDALFLERVMVKPFANLSILSTEEPLNESITPQATAGEALIAALQEEFPLVIIDLPRQINPLAHVALAQADLVVLVAEPSLMNLRDALRIKDYLVDTLKRPMPSVIVNRRGLNGKHELIKSDFTKHFGAAPAAEIPYLVEAFEAMSRGETLLSNVKGSALVDPLRGIAAKFTGKKMSGAKKSAKKPEKQEPMDKVSAFFDKLRKTGK
jgi:pilus assembly protein CpaE